MRPSAHERGEISVKRRAAISLIVRSLVLVVVSIGGGPVARAGERCLRTTMPSATLGERERTVRVYLPPSYERPEAATRRYPVVYLLHGWPGSDGNWVTMGHACPTADSLIAQGAIPEVILVFPNGEGHGLLNRSMWLDSYDGRTRMATYVARDLVAWVDSLYRTRREPRFRALIGLSDGGTGAFQLALQHPELFGAAASHSGTFRLTRSFGDGAVAGPEPGASAFLARNSPAAEVERDPARARALTLYFDCGSRDESLADNRAFDARLTALGVPHTFHEYPGSHDWGYWRAHLHESLVAVTRGMR
jgi:putative tributyrin esterase